MLNKNKIKRFFGLPEFTQTMVGNNTSQEDKVFYGTNEPRPIYQTNVKNLKIKNGHYDGAYLKKGGIVEPNGNGVYIDKRTGYKYDGEFSNGNANGIGVVTWELQGKMLMKYEGEVKNDAIFVKTAKETKQNTKRTLVFRSSKLDELQKGNYNTFETATWGEGRISNEDPLVTRYNDIKSVHNVMEIIKQLPHVEKGELTLLKLVFHQHGSPDGTNDIGFRDEHADIILGMLWEKGYKDIEFSDLACNGPVASALETVAKRVDWNGKEERPGTTFSTRGSVVGRIVVNCNSACGTTFRTFGNDNEARKREKHTYTGYFGDMSRPKMSNQYPSYRCWMGDMPNPKMSNPNTLQVHPSITTAIELPEIEFESMDCFKVNKVLPTTQPKFLQNYCNQSIVPNAIAR